MTTLPPLRPCCYHLVVFIVLLFLSLCDSVRADVAASVEPHVIPTSPGPGGPFQAPHEKTYANDLKDKSGGRSRSVHGGLFSVKTRLGTAPASALSSSSKTTTTGKTYAKKTTVQEQRTVVVIQTFLPVFAVLRALDPEAVAWACFFGAAYWIFRYVLFRVAPKHEKPAGASKLRKDVWELRPDVAGVKRKFHTEWYSNLVSLLHAPAVTVGGLLCLWQSRNDDAVACFFGYRWLPARVCGMFLGYLFYDLALIVASPSMRSAGLLVHHALFITCAMVCKQGSFFKFPFAWLIAGEMSTPLLSIRWMLAASKRSRGNMYLAVCVALLVAFAAVRVFLYGYGLSHLWRHYELIVDVVMRGSGKKAPALASWRIPFFSPVSGGISVEAIEAAAADVSGLGVLSQCLLVVAHLLTIGYVLNLTWFTLLAVGLRRVLRRRTDVTIKES